MRDFISIGPAPAEEDCAQLGTPDYPERSREECRRFIALIRGTLGEEPEGAWLRVKRFEHDFGSYREVVCFFDDTLPDSVAYAFRCEAEAPATWE